MKNQIPVLFRILISLTSSEEDYDQFFGDFQEAYYYKLNGEGKLKAGSWLCWQIITSLPGMFLSRIIWGAAMIRNYFKIAFRNIFKNKIYSTINILGFAVGLAAAILTFLFVLNELRVNMHFKDIDQIYQVKVEARLGNDIQQWEGTPSAAAGYLKENYSEVLESAVITSGVSEFLVDSGTKKFLEATHLCQFSYFKVFSHEILKGNLPDNDDVSSIIIDNEIAYKYFGNEDPIGKVLRIDNNYDLKVAAVFKKMENNCTDPFSIVVPFKLIDQFWSEGQSATWDNHAFRVYIKTIPNFDLDTFNKKIENIVVKNSPESNSYPYLFPFKDKYLISYGAIDNVKIYSIITLLLLLVASINYINLSNARAMLRAREVGIRKVVGAKKKQIIGQFFFESLIITLMAVVIASGIITIVYPEWKSFQNLFLPLNALFSDVEIAGGICCIIFFTTILSSIYPAVIISSFKPKQVLKTDLKSRGAGKKFKSMLVLVQFTVSIVLAIVTLTIARQTDYLQNMKLGFEKDQIVHFPLRGELENKPQLIKNNLESIPGVLEVSLSSHIPGSGDRWNTTSFSWQGKPDGYEPLIQMNAIDEKYINLYEMKIKEGEGNENIFQPTQKILINETMAKMLNKENVIGENIRLTWAETDYQVIGVIKDFHHRSGHRLIEPFIFFIDEDLMPYQHVAFKIDPSKIKDILSDVEKAVSSMEPNFPFSYNFLDEDFSAWYEHEEKLQATVLGFGIIAVFISCLGLFGMATYSTNQKIKEIGIRRVLGSEISTILLMLVKEFTKWVVLANLIAWPTAYYYLSKWLENYAYRTNPEVDVFIICGLGAFLIALVTIIGQAYRAATRNPVNSLRVD